MLDIQFIRDNRDTLQEVAMAKGLQVDLGRLIQVDEERRTQLRKRETLRQQRNQASKEVSLLAGRGQGDGPEAAQLKEQVRAINEDLADVEARWNAFQAEYDALMLLVPNIVSPDTPRGTSDVDNVEIRRVGELPHFAFDPLDHVTLGERLYLIDIPRGVKVGGSRSYFLKNGGLYLHRAVQQLAIDLLTQRGFTVMDVPVMVREEALNHTGFFPGGESQTYRLPADDLWLVGTAEAPLVSYLSDDTVDVRDPIRVAGISNCYRREAGSAGRDVRGL